MLKKEFNAIMQNVDSCVQKIISIIYKHIDDSEFRIEKLCIEAGMSRSAVFRKVKQSFGMSPVLLIRSLRLEYGFDLLQKKNVTVIDVAYACGFTSSQYFSICFKQKYGFSPSALIKK